MLGDQFPDILRRQGFERIGQMDFRLRLTVWWNPAPDQLLEAIVLDMGNSALIKASKSYYLQSVTSEGETWARDIPSLHDYLENHFPELRISFSHFRDVPPALAEAEARRKMGVDAPTRPIPTVEQIGNLQRQLQVKQLNIQATQRLFSLSDMPADLLTGQFHHQTGSDQHEIDQLNAELQQKQERLELFRHLQRQYQQKGSAALYTFCISSNVHVAHDPNSFNDALSAVVKEMIDQHRYQVMQKLQGGRLNIQVAPADRPVISWIEQWFGGALSPTQLQRIGPAFDPLRNPMSDQTMVMPDQPIAVDGHVRQDEKHLAAHFVSTILNRLDKTDSQGQNDPLDPDRMPIQAMPLRVGQRIDDAGHIVGPAVLPLAQIIHGIISGTTGSGKSYLGRVMVEEAAMHKDLNILILDPRNQFAGLLVPEDRTHILEHYPQHGMNPSQARGFAFDYFAPQLGSSLPQKLAALAVGRRIVSFKGMDDRQRCSCTAKILNAAFETIAVDESDHPRLLIVIDEAHLLTRKRVDKSAHDAATEAQRAMDRIAREGRKYGIVILLLTQTIKDFSHEMASLRQMMTTKIFLRNSDLEIDYAADILGDGRMLVQLPTGTALVHNANWGTHRIRVRPPYSKVFELSDDQIRQLFVHDSQEHRSNTLSIQGRDLLEIIKQHTSPTGSPLNLSRIAELAGMTSRRQLHELIGELEEAGAIRTRKLHERGQPRVVELTKKQTD